MGPRKKPEQVDEALGASAGADAPGAGEGASAAGAPEEPTAPAAEEGDGAAAAADAGLGVQPDGDAGAVSEEPAAEQSSWDRLAQRTSA